MNGFGLTRDEKPCNAVKNLEQPSDQFQISFLIGLLNISLQKAASHERRVTKALMQRLKKRRSSNQHSLSAWL